MAKPLTLKELVDYYNSNSDEFRVVFANWLDRISEQGLTEPLFEEEPCWGAISVERKAFLASSVHFLSRQHNLTPPDWCYKKEYFLEKPYFSTKFNHEMLRWVLLLESPTEFRVRNVFVSENALSRA